MNWLKQFFRYSDEYKEATKQYTKTDLFLAIAFYFILLLIFYGYGKIIMSGAISLTYIVGVISTAVISILYLSIVLIICFIRKQPLRSIGFDATHVKKSFWCGIILIVILIGYTVIKACFTDFKINGNIQEKIVQLITQLIFIAFIEEVTFRGYIGTRIYGSIKNKFLAVILTGIMFSMMHIPFQLLRSEMGLFQYIQLSWPYLVTLFFWHIVFQFLYAKYNSVVAPTLLHFVSNYLKWLVVF